MRTIRHTWELDKSPRGQILMTDIWKWARRKNRYLQLPLTDPNFWKRVLFGSGDKQRLTPGYLERSWSEHDPNGVRRLSSPEREATCPLAHDFGGRAINGGPTWSRATHDRNPSRSIRQPESPFH